MILAIDPGPRESAWLLFGDDRPQRFGIEPNDDLLHRLRDGRWWLSKRLVIEMVESFGMPVGRDVFETVLQIGRLMEAFRPTGGTDLVYRRDVKLHLCNSARAKDANIRQALLDRYGGKEKAVGRKKAPGPLYGIRRDLWSALAVAVTYEERS